MPIEELYQLYLQHPLVQTDTRSLSPGCLFFALKGENFNGNQFAAQALEQGAAYAIIDEPAYAIEGMTILVTDVLTTLQALAGYHRNQLSIPVIGITGSNGKTTSKELVHAVLSTTYKTATTQGNLNNHIGIPLTLFRIPLDAEMAVIEMGANHQKEIAGYCTYVAPSHGIITNCGKAHLEGFSGVEGVRKGKGELYDHLRNGKGTVFVMWDYDYLRTMSAGIPYLIKYGTREADIEGSIRQAQPFLEVEMTKGPLTGPIRTQLVGDYNLPNVLMAVAVGSYFNVAPEKIRTAIESYTPSNSRSQLINQGTNHILLDAYNANPSSMLLAIENLTRLAAKNKILMLGAMAELGADSLAEHQQILDLIQQHSWKEVVLVGGDFLTLEHPYRSFSDSRAAGEWYRSQGFEHCHILIKGSRSQKMERILES
ncbi:MAG: UDP-N-acetylmuramoyl-tripeptide--D-alanyl-D-alanine ligase [Bacteroidetes bacterium]|nr:UDP-N-acetylmuramoyl-tripeptide--D-alanyl-D-alanine ligase [Bacteroidota bacterium]